MLGLYTDEIIGYVFINLHKIIIKSFERVKSHFVKLIILSVINYLGCILWSFLDLFIFIISVPFVFVCKLRCFGFITAN